jgi:lipoprotein-anchoring transpeptidase ErfK/SrfK
LAQFAVIFPAETVQASPKSDITRLAIVRERVPTYARPGRKRTGSIPPTWYGHRTILPIIGTRPGWVKVRLAQRPNGSTAWVRDHRVRPGRTPYRIVIDLARTRLTLYRDGRRILKVPAGVGTAEHPTPVGRFFMAFQEPQLHPAYGPFLLVTSAHAVPDGATDPLVAIHGPLDGARQIGATGTRISHGCIRLHTHDLRKLRRVPPGTPIDILRRTPTPPRRQPARPSGA